MTRQLSENTIKILVIISFIANILIVIGIIMNARYFDNNCWNNYNTEREAILNCEGEQ